MARLKEAVWTTKIIWPESMLYQEEPVYKIESNKLFVRFSTVDKDGLKQIQPTYIDRLELDILNAEETWISRWESRFNSIRLDIPVDQLPLREDWPETQWTDTTIVLVVWIDQIVPGGFFVSGLLNLDKIVISKIDIEEIHEK